MNVLVGERATGEVRLFASKRAGLGRCVEPLLDLVAVELAFGVLLEKVHVRGTLAFVGSVSAILLTVADPRRWDAFAW